MTARAVFVADWGTGGLQGPLCQVQLQGRQEGRRPEDQLGRQQGRDRHHHRRRFNKRLRDACSERERRDLRSHLRSSAALALAALALRPRRRRSPPTRPIRPPTPRRSRNTSPSKFPEAEAGGFRQRSLFDERGHAPAMGGEGTIPALRILARHGQGDVREAVQERQELRAIAFPTRASASARTIPISTRRKARSSRSSWR